LTFELSGAAQGGPRAMVALTIRGAYRVLVVALFVRVIGSWIGAFRYSRWMRPAYLLTDWVVEPIRRILPAAGPFDISPIVAWFVLWLLSQLLLSVI
jgi:YggT family protein